MVFAYPAALIGIVAVAGLVATYFFRSRFRRRNVSSLMLWRVTATPSQGGARRERLILPWIFWLELAAVCALVLAAAAPLVRRPAENTLSVVLDASASMSATGSDGITARERAARALERELRRSPAAAVRIISANASGPELIGTFHPDKAPAAIASARTMSPANSIAQAIARAAEFSSRHAALVVLSDTPPPVNLEIKPPVKWIAVGESMPNIAITFADRSPAPDGTENLLVELRSFPSAAIGTAPKSTRIAIASLKDGAPIHTATVNFNDEGSARLAMPLPHGTPDAIAVLPDDALAFDNSAFLPAAETRTLAVAVNIADDNLRRAVTHAVNATGLATILPESTPDTQHGAAHADIVFADAGAAKVRRNQWQVLFHKPQAPRIVAGPYMTDSASSLLEGVALNGTVWNAGTNSLAGRALAIAGHAILISAENTQRSGTVHIQADGASSTFFRTPAWPAFVWNVLDAASASRPGPPGRIFRVGQPITLHLAEGERAAAIKTPEGNISVRAAGGRAEWTPSAPGCYALTTDGATMPFCVNLFASEESDLSHASHGAWGGGSAALRSESSHRHLAWAAGLLALALLILHHAIPILGSVPYFLLAFAIRTC